MANSTVRELPRSMEAEQAVLGSALFNSQYLPKITARLKREDFYFLAHQHVYDAIITLQLSGRPVDVLTVATELERLDLLPAVGGRVYVTELPDKVPVYANFEHYMTLVRQHAMMRRFILSLNEILGMAYKGDALVNQLIDLTAKRIYDIRENRDENSFEKLGDILGRIINRLQAQAEGQGEQRIRTMYPTLDAMLDGLRPGGLYILAARPGVGKTSFALNIASNTVKHQHATAIFSLEMSKEEVGMRILATESRVSSKSMERITPKQMDLWSSIAEAFESLFPVPLYIDDRSGSTVVEMQAKCKQLQFETGLDLVIVDYLQLMSGGGRGGRQESRQQEIAEISRMLKMMARELNVPIVALSQLSRDSEKAKRRPRLSDLRESGAIEQDADVVMFLHEPVEGEETNEKKAKPDAKPARKRAPNEIDILVAKNRHGEVGTIHMGWNATLTQFYEPEFYASEDS